MQPTNAVTAWSGDAPLVGLPQPMSTLVGRERELERLQALIIEEDASLITLTGPGGVGKSRLAIAVAHTLAPNFQRAQFLPLAIVHETAAVPGILASRLGLRETGHTGVSVALEEAFARSPTLVVLDNLEHLPGADEMVAGLLAMPVPPRIIATSRIRLGLPDEIVFPVPPLSFGVLPSNDAGAVMSMSADLFLQRVQAQFPGFVTTPDRLADIEAICSELEGLPLAIELAAARCRIMSPHEVRLRLRSALDLLAGNSSAHAEHQRTMRRTIAWSVDLLDGRCRDLFGQLAAFGGLVDRAAASAVAEVDLDMAGEMLDQLVEQHLLVRDPSLVDVTLLRFPGAVREFATEHLARRADRDAVNARMAAYMHRFVRQATQALRGPGLASWTRRLDVEMANIIRALAWLEENERFAEFADILIWMQPHWLVRGRYDIMDDWLERGVALTERDGMLDSSRRNGILVSASRMTLGRGDIQRARSLIDRVVRDDSDLWGVAKETEQRGMVDLRSGDYLAAIDQFEQARAASQQLGNDEAEAWALHGMAAAWLDLGALEQAAQTLNLARQRYEAVGSAHGVALVEDSLSQVLHGQGRTSEALESSRAALAVFREAANYRRAGIALDNIGRYARDLGQLHRAREAHLEACRFYREAGDSSSFVAWLRRVVALMMTAGDHQAAGQLFAIVQPLQERHGSRMTRPELRELERILPRLAEPAQEELWLPAGVPRRMPSLDDAIDQAVAWLERSLSEVAAPVPVGPSPALAQLTRREREIVELLVEGLTDQQIADRLGISIRTVGKHLSTAYGRLGVNNRRDAARLAAGREVGQA